MIIFSSDVKHEIIKRLQDIDLNAKLQKLSKGLIEVALQGHRFPDEFGDELQSLQDAYFQNNKNLAVQACLRQAIEIYFKTKGLQCFNKVLVNKFDEKQWSSYLLFRLMTDLNLGNDLQINPVVECTLQNSKIYWRIKDADNNVLYRRHEDVYFENTKTWIMPWKSFRKFKDSGKRSGTVEITKERFIDYFDEESRPQAAAVWDELKSVGILNSRNKISDGWRALVSKGLYLKSLSSSGGHIIEKKDVMHALKPFKNQKLTREKLIKWTKDKWGDDFTYRMGLVWDKLEENGDINKENKLVINNTGHNLSHIPIADVLKKFEVTYADVADALTKISNYKKYKEQIIEVEGEVLSIFRPELSRKTWVNGSVENFDPRGVKYCAKLWYVGIHHDLNLHRKTEFELEEYDNEILNYDHVPSCYVHLEKIKTRLNLLCEQEGNANDQREQIEDEIEARRTKLSEDHAPASRKKFESDNQIIELNKKKGKVQETIKSINSQIHTLTNENKKDGYKWWTIAIPEVLHRHGETYMQSGNKQVKDENIFLQNIMVYFELLENNAKRYSLNFIEHYLEALGAFRYLYHQQIKNPEKVCGQYSVGTIGQLFFTPEYKDEIDGFFTRKMEHYLKVKEGMSNFVPTP